MKKFLSEFFSKLLYRIFSLYSNKRVTASFDCRAPPYSALEGKKLSESLATKHSYKLLVFLFPPSLAKVIMLLRIRLHLPHPFIIHSCFSNYFKLNKFTYGFNGFFATIKGLVTYNRLAN